MTDAEHDTCGLARLSQGEKNGGVSVHTHRPAR